MPSQPGASPQEPIRKSHQGPKARSIMPHAGTSTAFLMGRAVGAEYRFESISWGDAPGWDDAGALPLKRIRNFELWILNGRVLKLGALGVLYVHAVLAVPLLPFHPRSTISHPLSNLSRLGALGVLAVNLFLRGFGVSGNQKSKIKHQKSFPGGLICPAQEGTIRSLLLIPRAGPARSEIHREPNPAEEIVGAGPGGQGYGGADERGERNGAVDVVGVFQAGVGIVATVPVVIILHRAGSGQDAEERAVSDRPGPLRFEIFIPALGSRVIGEARGQVDILGGMPGAKRGT